MFSSLSAMPRAALTLACLLPIVGAFFVSTGLFTIDEFIYLLSAEAMASHGALTVDNGFSTFGSQDLRLWFLVEGPNGLAPQYPPGVAVLGTPFYVVFGVRGLILLNAVAAVGVAFLTWRIALSLYADATVALVSVLLLIASTFYLDYAWSIWPHMTSAFFVMLGFYSALTSMSAERAAMAGVLGAAAGLSVGIGMTLRADAILAIPIFTACAFLYARRPVMTILGGVLGFVPMIGVLALVNLHKFGTLNFLSYGRTGAGGGDDVITHSGVAIVFVVTLLALLVARRLNWSPRTRRPAIIAGLAGLAALLVIPPTSDFLRTLAGGYTALFIDTRTIADPRDGVGLSRDGSMVFWGVAKKAVFQSLPWLGVLAALFFGSWGQGHRKGHLMLLIFIVFWSLPFASLAWHGGFSSSMRYFMPMLVPLTLLGAALLVDLAGKSNRSAMLLLSSAGLGVALSFAVFLSDHVSAGFTQQALNLAVFLTVAALVTAATLRTPLRRIARPVALAGVGLSLGISFFGSVIVDVSFSQLIRERSAVAGRAAEQITGPTLFYGSPKIFAFAAQRPDALVGVSGRLTGEIDIDLFSDALADGYRVYAPVGTAHEVAAQSDLVFFETPEFPDGSIVEVMTRPEIARF